MIKSSRYIIAIICLIVIILRLIYPDLNFDLISLSLLAIATLAILINKPEKILEKTKKIKLGSFELELQELNKKTEIIEEKTTAEKDEPRGLNAPEVETKEAEFEISTELSTNILKLSIEIEKTLKEIYELGFHSEEKIPISVFKLIQKLNEGGIIDNETSDLLKSFWNLRNKTVHNHNFEIEKKEFISFTDVGIRILRILKIIRNNKFDGKLPHYGLN